MKTTFTNNKNLVRIVLGAVLFILFTGNVSSQSMLRLKMTGLVNSSDETVIYYQDGATTGFDSEFDAYKIFGPNPAPHISLEYDSILFAINGIDPVDQSVSMELKTTTPISGNFTITATDFSGLPKGTCVYITDLITGANVNILTDTYAFTLSNSTTMSRFVVTITHYELPVITS